MNMVERVAEVAAREARLATGENVLGGRVAWDVARAVIRAMREPTPDMVDTMRDVGPDRPYGLSETTERWIAGVDAALAEGPDAQN